MCKNAGDAIQTHIQIVTLPAAGNTNEIQHPISELCPGLTAAQVHPSHPSPSASTFGAASLI